MLKKSKDPGLYKEGGLYKLAKPNLGWSFYFYVTNSKGEKDERGTTILFQDRGETFLGYPPTAIFLYLGHVEAPKAWKSDKDCHFLLFHDIFGFIQESVRFVELDGD